MIDLNSFLLMVLFILGSILLVVLIVLGIKLINTITRIDRVLDEFDLRIKKFDNVFSVIDVVTDSMALVSDKIVDVIVFGIKKIFKNKKNGKEEDKNE
ncbi:MAG: hypothetical protein VZS44_00895 [Bacilli bacterium]|nr:hypothetical protein [Bacilli bacterium]